MTNLVLYGGSEYPTSNEMYSGVVPTPGSLPVGFSGGIYLGPTVPGLTWGGNPTRTTYTPPVLLPLPPAALDLSITEGLNLSSDDEKETNGLSPTYSDSRGAGAQWSNNRVVVASNATSSQLVSGDFGFKIPPNAVIKSVEIDLTDAVVAGSLTSETVDVLTCAFVSSFNANIAGVWFAGSITSNTVTWTGTNWELS